MYMYMYVRIPAAIHKAEGDPCFCALPWDAIVALEMVDPDIHKRSPSPRGIAINRDLTLISPAKGYAAYIPGSSKYFHEDQLSQ